jgi:hypothetical protein
MEYEVYLRREVFEFLRLKLNQSALWKRRSEVLELFFRKPRLL